MKPCGQGDKALIEHMLECVAHIREYTRDGRNVFLCSGLGPVHIKSRRSAAVRNEARQDARREVW